MHLDPDDAIAGQHVPGLERPPLRHLVAKSRLRQEGVLLLRDQGAKELFLDQLGDKGLRQFALAMERLKVTIDHLRRERCAEADGDL